MKRVGIALLACAVSATAMADSSEHPYLGLDYQSGSFSQSGISSVRINAIAARLGSELWPNLAVEAHVATGLQSSKISFGGSSYDLNLVDAYGAFVRPQLKLGDDARVFLLGGYSVVEYKARGKGGVDSFYGDENGASYGGGLDVGIGGSWRIGAEYVSYVRSYKALSVGVVKVFD